MSAHDNWTDGSVEADVRLPPRRSGNRLGDAAMAGVPTQSDPVCQRPGDRTAHVKEPRWRKESDHEAQLDRYVQAEIASQEELFAGMTLEEAIDSLEAIFDRQIRSDPLWTVLRMEFWLVASRDAEVRRRLVAKAEPFRQRAGEVIDDLLADAGQSPPFTGRELGILINALVTGLAVVRQHEPDAVEPKLLVRAVRQLAGLGPEGSNDGGGVVGRSSPSRIRRRRERPG
jgi:hypothetical protein